MFKTPVNSYRVYHIDAAGRRSEHTNFMASEDANACETALAIQETAGWPTIEVWARDRQVTCEAAPTDTGATRPDATWGRQIETALGYRPRAQRLRAEAATMIDPENKQTMLKLATNYEQMAERLYGLAD